MPDFLVTKEIYWSKDGTRLVSAGDKDAGPNLFAGPGGVVYEDQARQLGLIAEKAPTAFGREHGHVPSAGEVVERMPDHPASHTDPLVRS